MKQKTFVVTNRLGLPTRSVAALVHTVKASQSEVWVEKDGQKRDGRKIADLLTLPAPHGSKLTVTVRGEDEDAVMGQISDLMEASPFVGGH